jgi:hypothetical protein
MFEVYYIYIDIYIIIIGDKDNNLFGCTQIRSHQYQLFHTGCCNPATYEVTPLELYRTLKYSVKVINVTNKKYNLTIFWKNGFEIKM